MGYNRIQKKKELKPFIFSPVPTQWTKKMWDLETKVLKKKTNKYAHKKKNNNNDKNNNVNNPLIKK